MPGPSMLSPLFKHRLLLHAPCPPSRRCRVPADDRIRRQSRAADSMSCRPLCLRASIGHPSVARVTARRLLDPDPVKYQPLALSSMPGSAPVPPMLVCRSPTHCPVGQKNSAAGIAATIYPIIPAPVRSRPGRRVASRTSARGNHPHRPLNR